ncbi:hypothetical protein HPB51_017941 [Rhipicephalus microplus]|uniref:Uncharacterized protein n=1 Tax=Rhipicephalus microplus TaxID=6941 RepID=A0A9J6ENV0_RHIMP|nr:hypothetical protein HPB51_017941 [Rhipicephalus microplus]
MRAALVPPLRPPVVLLLLFVLGGRWTSSLTARVDAEAERDERALHQLYEPGTPPSPEDEPEELLIAGFFPTTLNLSEGAIGRGVVPAVNLALRHINSSPHFLPGYRLDIIWNDTQEASSVERLKTRRFGSSAPSENADSEEWGNHVVNLCIGEPPQRGRRDGAVVPQ